MKEEIFTDKIKKALMANIPFIWIVTKEEEIAEKNIARELVRTAGIKSLFASSESFTGKIDGFTLKPSKEMEINNQSFDDLLDDSSDSCMQEIIRRMINIGAMLKYAPIAEEKTAFIIRNHYSVFVDTAVQRAIYEIAVRKNTKDVDGKQLYCPIFMISPRNDVPEYLKDCTMTIELPLLNKEEIIDILKGNLEGSNLSESDIDVDNLASSSAGLTKFQIEKSVRLGYIEANGKSVSKDAINHARLQAIRQSSVLTYVEPTKTLDDIGGHDALKDYLCKVKNSMTPEAIEFGIAPAKGLIALGLAGTGKSLVAEAIANYFGVPLIVFDMSRIMNSLVGQSERAAREAFELIDAVGDCVIMIDESDKAFSAGASGTGSNDGGTIARVFGIVLTRLQENRGQFYVMTANDISNLPAPLTRAGRLDSKWFFDFPTESDRRDIFNIYLKKANHEISEDLLDYAIGMSNNFTGAEISTAVNNIVREAFLDTKKITKKNIRDGILQVSPIYKTNRAEVDELRNYARQNGIPSTTSDLASRSSMTEQEKKSFKDVSNALDSIEEAIGG